MSALESKLFLFGGCYSNLQATQGIKEIADKLGFTPDQIICTGDIVGYCAQPEETVQLIKNWGIKAIAGNVEVQLRTGEIDCGCNFDEGSRCDTFSRQWFPYAQQRLSPASLDWMQALPNSLQFTLNDKRYHVLHGGTDDISEFIFESTPVNRKLEIFEETGADNIIAGHCGIPFHHVMVDKNGNEKNWINPGVIGMPANDGTARVWYGILDTVSDVYLQHSFDYEHKKASDLMVENHLPKEYANTLITGIWDNCEILPTRETLLQGRAIE
ncbi:MAG: metallophosphoesterase [Crocinitomix sp.]|nr:metallophosphoesterase [Crocinitomix sp.]